MPFYYYCFLPLSLASSDRSVMSAGDLDLFVGTKAALLFFRNTGNSSHPSFEAVVKANATAPRFFEAAAGFRYASPACVDLNHDGLPDLILGTAEAARPSLTLATTNPRHHDARAALTVTLT